MDNRPIGVFDSGVGGLSVVKCILNELPNEEIIYFGDTARAPYGNRSKDTISTFSKQIANFLISKNCKSIVVACNTSCVSNPDLLLERPDIPVIGVIDASVTEAVGYSNIGVGVIGTSSTVDSGFHKLKIQKVREQLYVKAVACPLFVEIVEAGFANSELAYKTALEYFEFFDKNKIDCLILACTHYPLMQNIIQKTIGENIKLIDPAFGTALELKKILTQFNLTNETTAKKNHHFYFSGDDNKFNSILESTLGKKYNSSKISVENF